MTHVPQNGERVAIPASKDCFPLIRFDGTPPKSDLQRQSILVVAHDKGFVGVCVDAVLIPHDLLDTYAPILKLPRTAILSAL